MWEVVTLVTSSLVTWKLDAKAPVFLTSLGWLVYQIKRHDNRSTNIEIDKELLIERKRRDSIDRIYALPTRPKILPIRNLSIELNKHEIVPLLSDDEDPAPIDENYPFDYKDTKRNICYVIDIDGAQIIRSATLFKLVEKLTEESGKGGSKYGVPFLLTYRSFCTPNQLLDLLMKRYQVPQPITTNEDEIQAYNKYKKHIQLRVWYIFKLWTEMFFYDFSSDQEMYDKYVSFLENVMNKDMDKLAMQLKLIIEKQNSKSSNVWGRTKLTPLGAPTPILPSKFTVSPSSSLESLLSINLCEFHPLEIARQMTLVEYDYYSRILPLECLNQSWNKEGKERKSPNILALVKRFNELCTWVVSLIVQETRIKERAAIMTHFIRIAAECRTLNNFNSMMSIVAGLNTSSISRLKKTWSLIDPTIVAQFQSEFTAMFASNFKKLREAIKQSSPPCLPYLGMYLQDLTFIEDGNQDIDPESQFNLINFEKRLMIARVIVDLRLYQQKGYLLAGVDGVREWIEKSLQTNLLNENQAYSASLQIEPREPKK